MATDEPAFDPSADAPDAGGDPVCWLHLVCESCGALLEREEDQHRPGCHVAASLEERL